MALQSISRLLLLSVVVALGAASGSAQKDGRKDHFDRWLKEDVVYIIATEERSVFGKLTTVEEKEQFVEQFWSRRDPTPGTAENEFKEEHYRRIKHANEKFPAGFQGWRTDRGRIYIKYGPPDEVTSYPSGGSYTREFHEGGGITSTYPFEIWRYNEIPGIGQDVEIEFVDKLDSGDYKIARDQFEKDALFHIGRGDTYWEQRGLITRAEINAQRYLSSPSSPFVRGWRHQDQPLERLVRYTTLMKAPPIRFTDLRGLVETNVTYDQVPVRALTHVKPIGQNNAIASITASIQVGGDNFKKEGEALWQAQTNVYGRVTSLAGKVVYEFDDDLTTRVRKDPAERRPPHLYQKKLALPPGRYKLDLVARETSTKKTGTAQSVIVVPRDSTEIGGTLILANGVTPTQEGDSIADPFVVSEELKVFPSVDKVFGSQAKLGVYVELYNLAAEPTTSKAKLGFSYQVSSRSGVVPGLETTIPAATVENPGLVNGFFALPLASLASGDYTISVEVKDLISGKTLAMKDGFRLQ